MLTIAQTLHSVFISTDAPTPVYSVSKRECATQADAVELVIVIPATSLKYEKPPLGILPRKQAITEYLVERITALNSAIKRYTDAGYPPNPEWKQELQELEEQLGRKVKREL